MTKTYRQQLVLDIEVLDAVSKSAGDKVSLPPLVGLDVLHMLSVLSGKESKSDHRSISRTCSTESSTRYRMIVAFCSCPIRTARPIAWSSTAGFHCGSRMWMRLAAVRLSLRWVTVSGNVRLNVVENLFLPKCPGP